MTDGDDETDLPAETLDSRLGNAAEALDAAETEADLDAVEKRLDGIAADLDAADFPAPDEDDADPAAELSDRIDSLHDDLAAARGPYAADVTDAVGDAKATLDDTRWTETGAREAVAAVGSFVAEVNETLGTDLAEEADAVGASLDALDATAAAVGDAGLDPDDDAETIATLLEATDALEIG
ncbi:MAG: HEAT repeat domain-containing protein, partial [Haloplanus sp.]